MKIKRIICFLIVLTVLMTSVLSVSASTEAEDLRFSEEYKTSPYYEKLIKALDDTKDASAMDRTLAVALSQEGYANFATEGYDLDQARAEGKLWTGKELRMNDNLTGNTEYTRWAQSYVMSRFGDAQYADYDWCAIFVSWCLYQAGYYSEEQLKKYYYAYIVDPRIFYDADSWIESFNLDQRMVYYPPKAHHKLDAMPWNTYYNVDIDPFDIPYKPGGLLFFSWDGTGQYYSHVAIVVDYDPDTHVLTYTNGNSDGLVITREIDLDVEESYRGKAFCKNCDRILAYADYNDITPPAQKEITSETNVIKWDKSESSGIKIKTNSESIMASVYLDNNYYGSIIESNMVFHEGLLSIGKSELSNMSTGAHKLRLVFDDGNLVLPLYITDSQSDSVIICGDVDLDSEITIVDATFIQRYDIHMYDMTNDQLIAANVDKDGDVGIIDVTLLQRWLVNLPSSEAIGTVIQLDT